MGIILVKEKDIVIPGEKVASGMDFLPSIGTFREGEDIFASKLGLVEIRNRVIKVIPLKGYYMPKRGDTVIGIVTDIGFSGWTVDIGAPAEVNLPVGEALRERIELLKSDLSKYFDIDDVILAKVFNVTKSRIVQLTMKEYGLKKLRGGRVVRITPSKVPRLIGKGGSMVSMIKKYTKCEINVGQNGYVWINGPVDGQYLAEKAIQMIEQKAHISGLTDEVKNMLEEGVKNEA
ncbi:MAG: RNA-binding protein [Nanoarchaeota archaeon]|nr:RNA-binding protein [Nanoarchaeota archaeon]